jgi:hypothetical protein
MTVFPQPKAPGIAQVPPRTEGNRASKIRCDENTKTEKRLDHEIEHKNI